MAQSILKTKSNVGPKMINTICLYLFSRYSLFVFFIYVLCIYIVCVCVCFYLCLIWATSSCVSSWTNRDWWCLLLCSCAFDSLQHVAMTDSNTCMSQDIWAAAVTIMFLKAPEEGGWPPTRTNCVTYSGPSVEWLRCCQIKERHLVQLNSFEV